MEPIVSVIIPVYNNEKFLSKSIESALNQKFTQLEIIAIDDGSTDNSLEILKQYSDRIKIFSQKNHGLAFTLNEGIKKMRGNWFKWLSPDDLLYPEAIELLVKETKNLPENTIIYSDWELIDKSEKKIREFSESNYNQLTNFEFNIRLLDSQLINVNTSLIPKTLFDKGCIFKNLPEPAAIDYDFLLRAGIFYKTKFHLLQKILVKYRIHNEQLSHQDIAKSLTYLEGLKNEILSTLNPSESKKYQTTFADFQKNKPLVKKLTAKSLNFSLKFLPPVITNSILLFYINKIRTSR